MALRPKTLAPNFDSEPPGSFRASTARAPVSISVLDLSQGPSDQEEDIKPSRSATATSSARFAPSSHSPATSRDARPSLALAPPPVTAPINPAAHSELIDFLNTLIPAFKNFGDRFHQPLEVAGVFAAEVLRLLATEKGESWTTLLHELEKANPAVPPVVLTCSRDT